MNAIEQWERDGWLHLRGFFPRDAVQQINAVVDEVWRTKPRGVTVDDIDAGRRTRMSRLDDAQRAHRIKLSDLYLDYAPVRDMLLDPRLVDLVQQLLGDAPVLCNSLNLERSSAQEYHADSLYMTPPTPQRLVAAWVALEDVAPGSGPLRLYPGSHRLPPFTFSDGGRHAIDAELPKWAEHYQGELDRRGMQPHVVMASAGDVILWHADLLHGAEEIRDAHATRRSLVAHYLGKQDCLREGYRVVGDRGRHWIRRPAQPVGLPSRIAVALERRWCRVRAKLRG